MPEIKEINTPTKAELTRERILQAAERAFARRGLRGTRVREIADEAGVNGATLYTYYPDKRRLYEAILERGMRPVLDLMDEFAAGPGGVEAGERLLDAVMRHLAQHPQLPRLIYLETISEGSQLSHIARRWLHPLLEQILGALKGGDHGARWEESLYPLVATAFIQLTFGHFALAPLMAEIFHRDPLAPEWIEQQTNFIRKLIHQMFSPDWETNA
jgi:TetR/AcrR family transcriptional regulator